MKRGLAIKSKSAKLQQSPKEGSSLLLNGARQTDNERHRRSKSEPCRVSSGALVQIVVGAATTGWRLTQLRPQRAASSPASSVRAAEMGSEAPASFPSSIFFADCNEEEKGGSKQNGRRRRQMRVHGIPSNNKTVQRSKFQMLHCTALSRGRDRIHDFIRPMKTGTGKV